jgi:hypothetical protein
MSDVNSYDSPFARAKENRFAGTLALPSWTTSEQVRQRQLSAPLWFRTWSGPHRAGEDEVEQAGRDPRSCGFRSFEEVVASQVQASPGVASAIEAVASSMGLYEPVRAKQSPGRIAPLRETEAGPERHRP